MTYELDLPSELAVVNRVFYISMLKKCLGNPSLIVPTHGIGVKVYQFKNWKLSCKEKCVFTLM